MNKYLLLFLFILLCNPTHAEFVEDSVAKDLPKNTVKPYIYRGYNYESTVKIPVTIKILEPIKSEKKIYEGQKVEFKVTKPVSYNERVIIKRGDIIDAKVSVIITPGMNGIPASIIFSDFALHGTENVGQLTEAYEVFGHDRSLLVFPLKWALTFLPPTGSLTNFIMGGHAKVKDNKLITIYCYPEWQ